MNFKISKKEFNSCPDIHNATKRTPNIMANTFPFLTGMYPQNANGNKTIAEECMKEHKYITKNAITHFLFSIKCHKPKNTQTTKPCRIIEKFIRYKTVVNVYTKTDIVHHFALTFFLMKLYIIKFCTTFNTATIIKKPPNLLNSWHSNTHPFSLYPLSSISVLKLNGSLVMV